MNVIFNRTKIIATIGPASNTKEMLVSLANAGVNVFRINFSHGTHEEHKEVIDYIKQINEERGSNHAILADLQGPKIRVGKIENNGIELEEWDVLTITTDECVGNKDCVYLTYKNFPQDVRAGEVVLMDDGKLQFEVIETDGKKNVKVRTIHGGILSSKKGVNLPNTKVSLPCLTVKDLKDLSFVLKQEVHWIALSFVRSATDVFELKKFLQRHNSPAKVIAKIEKPEAIEDIDDIIEETDAIMVARGDLGVEVPVELLPNIQKAIVSKCIRASKPVIIATQLMESMISNPTPSRAEVADVANSVYDGADAVMLSGETSVGKFPVRVIETITKIIDEVEKDPSLYMASDGSNKWGNYPGRESFTFLSDAVCFNACKISDNIDARAIIGMTKSGYTGYKISSFRPKAKIFVFTENKFLLNILSLVWGVKAFYYDRFVSTDETIADVLHILKTYGFVRKGDIAINTASMPIRAKARTNMLKVSVVE